MGIIGKEVAGRMAKESELMKIHIKKEDVQLIVSISNCMSCVYGFSCS